MRRATAFLTVTAALFLAACGAGEPEALEPLSGLSSDAERPTRPVSSGGTQSSPSGPPTLQGGHEWAPPSLALLDPGAEPRGELRWAPTPGSSSNYRSIESQAVSMEGDAPLSVSLPAYEVDIRVEVLEVTDEGFVVDHTPVDGRVPPSSAASQLVREARAEIDRRIADGPERQRVTSDGHLVQAVLRHQPSAEPYATPELHPPFPKEPVGVGARWRWQGTNEDDGVTFAVTGEVEITAIEGPVVRGTLRLVLDTEDSFAVDGAEIFESRFEFAGPITWHLDRGVVLRDLDGTVRIHARGPQREGGQEMRMTQNHTMREHLLD